MNSVYCPFEVKLWAFLISISAKNQLFHYFFHYYFNHHLVFWKFNFILLIHFLKPIFITLFVFIYNQVIIIIAILLTLFYEIDLETNFLLIYLIFFQNYLQIIQFFALNLFFFNHLFKDNAEISFIIIIYWYSNFTLILLLLTIIKFLYYCYYQYHL